MPLRYQPVAMPFGSSQDESTHDMAVQSPVLQTLSNCRVTKGGSVSKRLGWTEYCPYAPGVGDATVFEHNGALLLKQQNTTSFTHAPRYLSAHA